MCPIAARLAENNGKHNPLDPGMVVCSFFACGFRFGNIVSDTLGSLMQTNTTH